MTSLRLFALGSLAACASPAPTTNDPVVTGKADGASPTRRLPDDLSPLGGDEPSRWTPEAILANAVTPILQRDPSARVSIPATLARSSFAPYGDGQTNAAAGLGSWREGRPPVIGIRRAHHIEVRFDHALVIAEPVIELWSNDGTWLRSVPATRTPGGDLAIEITDPAPLGDRFVVSPRGWRDGFPLAFAIPLRSIADLAATLPADRRTLPGGEPVVDPVGAAGDDAAATLRSTTFPAGFVNQQPYVTDTLHAAFPQGSAPRVTAVGGALTWVANAPFENLYVCLDPRAPSAEAGYGVPSGSGWHHIGDAGESLLSSLATSPLLIGYAEDVSPTIGSAGTAAYGLDRALTFGLLQPGDAFTSPRGAFHWYAVHQSSSPCVQIWKHACAPDPRTPSMACR